LKVSGLLKYVIPEFLPAIRMTQNIHHKKDVFGHILDVLKGTDPVLVQRLMALFHDIGKTVTRSVTPSGVHFYGHEEAGAEMARVIMQRLKYPNEIIDQVVIGIANHMKLKHGGDDAVKLSDKTLRKFKVALGDKLENTLAVIHADNTAHSDASSMPNQVTNVRIRLNALDASTPSTPTLPIGGKDLISMGIKPGPIFRKILDTITEKWFENPDITGKEALHIAKSIANSTKK
jgi:tRNA nucleotidyltransferase (CCA-adding enzyme)